MPETKKRERICFHDGCEKQSEYEIFHDKQDNSADSCLEHIPALLTDSIIHTLYLIDEKTGETMGA